MKAAMVIPILIGAILLSVSVGSAGAVKCETEASKMDVKAEGYKPLKVVSIFSLVADPGRYHNQRVSVVGSFRLYYDRMSLYVTREHFQVDEYSSMLWVDLPSCANTEVLNEMSEWQGMFVRIDGVFNASRKNSAAGTLEGVEIVSPRGGKSGHASSE